MSAATSRLTRGSAALCVTNDKLACSSLAVFQQTQKKIAVLKKKEEKKTLLKHTILQTDTFTSVAQNDSLSAKLLKMRIFATSKSNKRCSIGKSDVLIIIHSSNIRVSDRRKS